MDCGHVFEVKMLDRYMDEADVEGENEDVQVKHKECPTCNTPILYARRYGNIVKEILADYEAVKRRIVLFNVAGRDKIQRILTEVEDVKRSFKVEAEEIAQSITTGHVTSDEVTKSQNQVTFLKFLGELIVKYKITHESNKELYLKIHSLKARCHVCIQNPLILSNIVQLNSKRKNLWHNINKILQTQGLSKDEELTVTEPYDMVVKAKNLALGPWYKCSKGHVYSAVERVKEEGSISCPDCRTATQQTAQSRPEALSTPVKPSQVMVVTTKSEPAPAAKLERRRRPRKTPKSRE
ncbi:hypothetical protein ACROYT_G005638 [Oculina patagonica]